mgnify:CR=1 FL=1
MKDQVLSVEQMQKLKKLGIDDSKAKIYWVRQTNSSKCNDPINGKYFLSLSKGDNLMRCGFITYETTPTFTLQDMIELMPDDIDYVFSLVISKNYIAYRNDDSNVEKHLIYGDDSILENAYNMLVWLAENKYI